MDSRELLPASSVAITSASVKGIEQVEALRHSTPSLPDRIGPVTQEIFLDLLAHKPQEAPLFLEGLVWRRLLPNNPLAWIDESRAKFIETATEKDLALVRAAFAQSLGLLANLYFLENLPLPRPRRKSDISGRQSFLPAEEEALPMQSQLKLDHRSEIVRASAPNWEEELSQELPIEESGDSTKHLTTLQTSDEQILAASSQQPLDQISSTEENLGGGSTSIQDPKEGLIDLLQRAAKAAIEAPQSEESGSHFFSIIRHRPDALKELAQQWPRFAELFNPQSEVPASTQAHLLSVVLQVLATEVVTQSAYAEVSSKTLTLLQAQTHFLAVEFYLQFFDAYLNFLPAFSPLDKGEKLTKVEELLKTFTTLCEKGLKFPPPLWVKIFPWFYEIPDFSQKQSLEKEFVKWFLLNSAQWTPLEVVDTTRAFCQISADFETEFLCQLILAPVSRAAKQSLQVADEGSVTPTERPIQVNFPGLYIGLFQIIWEYIRLGKITADRKLLEKLIDLPFNEGTFALSSPGCNFNSMLSELQVRCEDQGRDNWGYWYRDYLCGHRFEKSDSPSVTNSQKIALKILLERCLRQGRPHNLLKAVQVFWLDFQDLYAHASEDLVALYAKLVEKIKQLPVSQSIPLLTLLFLSLSLQAAGSQPLQKLPFVAKADGLIRNMLEYMLALCQESVPSCWNPQAFAIFIEHLIYVKYCIEEANVFRAYTEEGREYLEYAARLLGLTDQAFFAENLSPKMRVELLSVLETFCVFYTPCCVSDYEKLSPEVKHMLKEGFTRWFATCLKLGGKIDKNFFYAYFKEGGVHNWFSEVMGCADWLKALRETSMASAS